MAAYCAYILLHFFAGLYGGRWQLVGALGFLMFLAACSARSLFPLPLTGLTLAILLSALFPLFALLSGIWDRAELSAGYAIKYFSLLFVILAASLLRLPPLYRAPSRWWGFLVLLAVLLMGWVIGVDAERVEGTFVNPNNFALAALSLLFFVDHERDPPWLRLSVHGLAAALVLISGTAGALLGYLAGLCALLLLSSSARPSLRWLGRIVLLAGLAALALRGMKTERLGQVRLVGPLWTKIQIVRDHYDELATDEDLDLWKVGQQYSDVQLTSSLWRLMHWRDILLEVRQAGWPVKLLGRGLGSSQLVMGILPHNDFLRFLFEVGLLGLLANLALWIGLYRRADSSVRWQVVMMAVYTFCENNLDNFLVMSLFALLIVSAQKNLVLPSPYHAGHAHLLSQ